MNIYSFNEFARELYINSLHPCDWLDNITPSIPFHSVVADAELPQLTDKQALIVIGEPSEHEFDIKDHKMTFRVFTVSENLEIIEDHRGEEYFSTIDGSKVEIKELGPLPENTTDQAKPDGHYKWNGETWVEDTEAKDEATKQKNIAFLSSETRRVNDAIAPLDDAIEFEIATEEEIVQHKELRKYRLLLNRVPNQDSWQLNPIWPECPEWFK